jgi:hypothetical protein
MPLAALVMTDTQTATKKASKAHLLRELEAMSEVMVREIAFPMSRFVT